MSNNSEEIIIIERQNVEESYRATVRRLSNGDQVIRRVKIGSAGPRYRAVLYQSPHASFRVTGGENPNYVITAQSSVSYGVLQFLDILEKEIESFRNLYFGEDHENEQI